MPRRPIIAIAPTHLPREADIRLACNYADSVIAAGGAPLILPLTADTAVYEALFPLADGVLLTGGHDIDPARYAAAEAAVSEPRGCRDHEAAPAASSDDAADATCDLTPLRDEVEWRLLGYALAHELPVFGICRGLQLMNAYLGGTLWHDLPRDYDGAGRDGLAPLADHNVHDERGDYDGDRIAHEVALTPGSRLARIFGTEQLDVNSLHHQAVRRVAPGLRVTAVAPDGVIEGLEAADGRALLGVQWHPEYFGTAEPHRRFFAALVDAACAYRV